MSAKIHPTSIAILLLFAVGSVSAAGTATSQFRFQPIRLLSTTSVTIQLPDNAGVWHLGITSPSATKGVPTAYVTGKALACPACPREGQMLPAFRELDWKQTGGALDLSSAANANTEILVLLALPDGTPVEVHQGNRSVLSTAASNTPTLYRTGLKATKSFSSIPSFFTATAVATDTPTVESLMGSNGVLLASPPLFKRHLVAMQLPKVTPSSSTVGAGILIQVDESGTVTRAEIVGEQTPFAVAMRAEMLNWRFRPILHEGKAVPARAMFTALLRSSGAIDIPGF